VQLARARGTSTDPTPDRFAPEPGNRSSSSSPAPSYANIQTANSGGFMPTIAPGSGPGSRARRGPPAESAVRGRRRRSAAPRRSAPASRACGTRRDPDDTASLNRCARLPHTTPPELRVPPRSRRAGSRAPGAQPFRRDVDGGRVPHDVEVSRRVPPRAGRRCPLGPGSCTGRVPPAGPNSGGPTGHGAQPAGRRSR